ncbi:Gfo/Idh/MocA family protein [Ferdinandcohnia quinoae]|uniref:Gfo/Idh/MocA family oxidoreductase n=1 Tax=Fredinandcohnia quinoae TaxID=2918902 RepID=A0AAW5EB95_9BACI|nr:Gfo/Idh/MocA family oxidoreductase [Fredinandcohnia sp. SECRCQ15]MCH1627142.1 Gfo/Idh/MocA family oxidoreductase [Fredinandcohnia sp. SECRCQ15]
MGKCKVGIIGTGFGAKVHAPMFNFHEGFEVVAISSVARGNVEEVKQISGVENVYTNWRLMLEQEQLDLLVVASAVHLHKEMVVAAFEKGIHVLCEKPMALDIDESFDMMIAKNNAGKFGLINHEFRFVPARLKVKEVMDSRNLGEILHIRYECSFANYSSLQSKSRGWLGQTETGGGMLGAIGSHMIDTLHWWTDSRFAEVFANLPIHVPTYKDKNGNIEQYTSDDAFQVIGTLDNGATITMELVTAANQTKDTYRLEIYGSNGTLVMLNDNQVYYSSENSPLVEIELLSDLTAPSDMPAIAARYYNGFQRMLDALHHTLSTGTKHPNLSDFEDGLDTQKVLDTIRLSAKEGRKYKVN